MGEVVRFLFTILFFSNKFLTIFPLEIRILIIFVIYFRLLNLSSYEHHSLEKHKRKINEKPSKSGNYEKNKDNLDLSISYNGSVFDAFRQLQEERQQQSYPFNRN